MRGLVALVVAITAAALLTVLPSTSAQAVPPNSQTWTQLSPGASPSARTRAAAAFGAAKGQLVLFGGASSAGSALGDTWVWTGSTWSSQSPATSPSARAGASMVWDPSTSQLLLFGGVASGTASNETWVWTGSNWSKLSPATSPTARSDAQLAYSPAGQKLVLFGGKDGSGTLLSDTWTWDGSTWTQYGGSAPSARANGAFAGNPSTGRAVLFGGTGASGALGDTWVWTGAAWSQLSPAASPSARTRAAVAFDPRTGRPQVVGGQTSSATSSEIWTWTGTNWVQASQPAVPPARESAVAVYYPPTSDVLLFGGVNASSTVLNETWSEDVSPSTGLGFSKVATTGPSGRSGAMVAYDDATGQLILFSGYTAANATPADTWSWDGSAWTQLSPATSPPGRFSGALAYNPALGKLILFGGQGSGGTLQDTWSWDGSTWTQITTATLPAKRVRPMLAYAYGTGPSGEGQMVLYGGASGSTYLNDTYLFTGTDWASPSAGQSTAPSAGRNGSAIAWDAATSQLLLAGGFVSGGYTAQTLQWTSSGWTTLAGALPSARAQSFMTWDDATGQIVHYGGVNGSGTLGDVSTWNGSAWTQLSGVSVPSPVMGGAPIVFDPRTGQAVIFSGNSGSTTSVTQNTWAWDYQPQSINDPTLALSAPLTGYDRSFNVLQSVQINSPGAGGWSISVQADQAPKNGAKTLTSPTPVSQPTTLTVNGSSASATATTTPTVSCLDTGCTAPSPVSGGVTYPVAVLTSGAATVYRSAASSGIGRNVVNLRVWSTIRADSYAGTYTNTLTVTTSYGP